MIHFRAPWVLWAGIATFLVSSTVWGARAFREEARIKRLPAQMGAKARAEALGRASLVEQCSSPEVLKSPELHGIRCRLGLLTGRATATPQKTSQQVRDAHADALATASLVGELGEYRPLNPPPDFGRLRFEALAQGCEALWAFKDAQASAQIRPSPAVEKALQKAQKDVERALGHDLGESACNCTKAAVGLTNEAGSSMERVGSLQQILTSRGCLLDLKGSSTELNPKRSGPQSRFSGRAAGLAAASSDQGQLLSFAKSRSVTLKRCVDKFSKVRPASAESTQLAACACRVIEKWRFPARTGPDQNTALSIPIGEDGLALHTQIGMDGKLESCGDLVVGGGEHH